MRARSQAREAAIKALYQLDLRPDISAAEVEDFVTRETRTPDAREFALELVKGVQDHREQIDREVESIAHNWKLSRMACIDRNVIRVGAFELLHRPDIPAAVAINEAVTIAKKYSTSESGNFVNGILDQVHQRRAAARAQGKQPE